MPKKKKENFFQKSCIIKKFISTTTEMELVGCRFYDRLPHQGPRPMGGVPFMGGGLSKQLKWGEKKN